MVSMETISTLNSRLGYFERSKLASNRQVSSASSWLSKPSRSRLLPAAEFRVSQGCRGQVEKVCFLISAAGNRGRLLCLSVYVSLTSVGSTVL